MILMKSIIKKLLCLFYYLFLFRRSNQPGFLLVVTYHRISELLDSDDPLKVSVSTFEKQILHLKANYSIISAKDLNNVILGRTMLPDKACLITFDDGWKDNYTHAFPVLRKHGIPALIFISTDFIGTGKSFWYERLKRVLMEVRDSEEMVKISDEWPHPVVAQILNIIKSSLDKRPPLIYDLIESLKEFPDEKIEMLLQCLEINVVYPADSAPLMLSWNDVIEMYQNGISFGSHTKSHSILTLMDVEIVSHELTDSKRIIEEKIGESIHFFAYPNGNYNELISIIVKNSNYKAAFTCDPAINYGFQTPFKLKRLNMSESSSDFLGVFRSLFYEVELSGVRIYLKQRLGI